MRNLYDAPSATLSQPVQAVEYLGFWVRFVASLLDNLWIFILFFIVSFLALMLGLINEDSFDTPLGQALQTVLPAALIIGLWVRYAATPGKMVFKGQILDAETLERVPAGRLALRYVGYIVCVLTLGLGFIWVGIDERKQGLHDKIAGTVVVGVKS